MKDEILNELWAIKDNLAKETNYNMKALFERLTKTPKHSSTPVAPKPLGRPKQPA
jgi:hypothetical protein